MKRRIFNTVLDLAGVTRRRWQQRPAALYCFNFHRVGNDDNSSFHPNLFSCTGARFSEIVEFLKLNFEMIGIDKVVDLVEKRAQTNRRFGLITFDDGYVDNYEVAFDVLRRQSCPAVFFLPTDFVNGDEIPWWDRIAWRIANYGGGNLRIPGSNELMRIERGDLKESIRKVLRIVKDSPHLPMEEKVRAIEQQINCPDINDVARHLFVSWDHVREMRHSGMWFGSHSKSHRILSHLSEQEQISELVGSKLVLEDQLGENVDALAYPLGGRDTYTEFTKRAAKIAGFRVAFNFIGGINTDPATNRYELNRISIDGNMSVRTLRRALALISPR